MKFYNEENERMQNDPNNYVLGLLYFNPNDKRVIVPKINKFLGWTLNFAKLYSYLIILGIIGFAIIITKIVSK
jgi:uncharacterized membrane protein